MKGGSKVKNNLIRYLLLVLNTIILLIPFYYLIIMCFKSFSEVTSEFTWWPSEWDFTNFGKIFDIPDFQPLRYFMNTVFVFVMRAAGTVLTCGIAAYGFVRYKFRYKNLIFLVLMSVLMVPGELLLIPMYELYIEFGWMDTYIPLFIGSWFGTDIFTVFMLKQFFEQIPASYFEAARIDGCGEFKAFFYVMLPLTAPVFATIIILQFTGTYNDIYSPSLYVFTREKYLVAQSIGIVEGMYAIGGGHNYPVPWNLVSAVNVIFIIPVLALFFGFQNAFVSGLTGGSGLKG